MVIHNGKCNCLIVGACICFNIYVPHMFRYNNTVISYRRMVLMHLVVLHNIRLFDIQGKDDHLACSSRI